MKAFQMMRGVDMNNVTWIAEIGVNHHGDVEKAKRMATKALECGASYVKFQYYQPLHLLGPDSPYLEYAKQCYLTKFQHEEIRKHCERIGAKYFISVFDVGDIGWANCIGSAMKIATRMNSNREFIAKVEQCKKLTFASVQPMTQKMNERFKLMWCVPKYPSVKEDVLAYPYNFKLGLSSHCPDWTASLEAYKLGARVFENHLCEDKLEDGCDIPASLTFNDYRTLIKTVAAL